MSKKLLLLSVNWPYKTGETFLENEIKYIQGFDEVYCLPFNCEGERTRSVPDNIRICPLKKISRKKALFVFLFTRLFWSEFFYLCKEHKLKKSNIKLLLQAGYMQQQRYRALKKWYKCRISKTDDVMIYTYWMASDAMAVSRLKAKGVKHVTRCHGFDLYAYTTNGDYLPFQRKILQSANKIMPISLDGAKYLNERYQNRYKEKIEVSRLGTFDWGYGFEKGRGQVLKIVSCSNIIPVKRVHLMLQALKYVKCSVLWLHFGEGYLRNELETQIKELPSHIDFRFEGYIHNQDLMKWYTKNAVDLFINVSESEGIPVSIMEATSFGIPVIATDVGGTGEIIKDGINGYLLPSQFEPQQLAELIDAFYLQTDQQRADMRKKTRDSWLQNYNAEKNYSSFYNIISGV